MFSHELKSVLSEEKQSFLLFSTDILWPRSIPVLPLGKEKGCTIPKTDILKAVYANGRTGKIQYGYVLLLRPETFLPERIVMLSSSRDVEEQDERSLRERSQKQEKDEGLIYPLDDEE